MSIPEVSEQASADRLGVALSGGGFRAAFFHMGVLGRLAERGLLRCVEVISTVSGGSIAGALYYIRLKRLLESTPDAEITDAMYCEVVAETSDLLLDGVRKNIRGRVFLNLAKNFAMAMPSYSRSDRIGDLYDRYFYKPAWEDPRPRRSWGRERQLELRELLIQPHGHEGPFDPEHDNTERQAKVPILLLNATSLNSGHNWRFEAVRMGEPLPAERARRTVVEDVDKNMRLEQGYFNASTPPALPESQRDFPLGLAVAASAGVPGVFQPIAVSNVYRGITAQLVDGGVHDNQGVQGLLDSGCSHLVISDASRQLDDAEKPSAALPGVVGRSLGISSESLRVEQLVSACRASGTYALMHLRKGLAGRRVEIEGSREDAAFERFGDVESSAFGVSVEVQKRLAKVRTDLDFFGDVEAQSLALDGYLMTRDELSRTAMEGACGPPADAHPSRPWFFEGVSDLIGTPNAAYLSRLSAASRRFFRPVRPALLGASVLVVLVALALVFRDSLSDWLGSRWTAWHVLLTVGAGLLVVGCYFVGRVRWVLLRAPAGFVTGSLIPAVFALPLFAWALVSVSGTPLLKRFGRIPQGT